MEHQSKATPGAIPQLALDREDDSNDLIELAPGYLAEAEVSSSMMEEFAHVDADVWLKFGRSA